MTKRKHKQVKRIGIFCNHVGTPKEGVLPTFKFGHVEHWGKWRHFSEANNRTYSDHANALTLVTDEDKESLQYDVLAYEFAKALVEGQLPIEVSREFDGIRRALVKEMDVTVYREIPSIGLVSEPWDGDPTDLDPDNQIMETYFQPSAALLGDCAKALLQNGGMLRSLINDTLEAYGIEGRSIGYRGATRQRQHFNDGSSKPQYAFQCACGAQAVLTEAALQLVADELTRNGVRRASIDLLNRTLARLTCE